MAVFSRRRVAAPLALAVAAGLLTAALLAAPASSAPAGVTERVSVGTAGQQADDHSGSPAISGNGRYVAFASRANLPVAVDPQPEPGYGSSPAKVYVRDRAAGGRTVWVSQPEEEFSATDPTISADGRFVAFVTPAPLVDADIDRFQPDIYVHDRDPDADGVYDEPDARRTSLATSPDAGVSAHEPAQQPALSADGHAIGYSTLLSPTPGDLPASAGSPAATRFVEFGPVRTSASRTVVFTNRSGVALPLTGVEVTGADASYFAAEGCEETLAPGGFCEVPVEFAPVDQVPFHAFLETTSPYRRGRTVIALAGDGGCRGVIIDDVDVESSCPEPRLRVSGPAEFRDTLVGASSDTLLTARNTSSTAVTIERVEVVGEHDGSVRVTGGTCRTSGVVVAGGLCSVSLRFTPRRVGMVNASIVFHTAPDKPDELITGRVHGVAVQHVVYLSSDNGDGEFGMAEDGTAQTVSVDSSGVPVEGQRPSLSATGRHVAYDSAHPVDPESDPDPLRDVYLRDMHGSGQPVLASLPGDALSDIDQEFDHATDASLSGDGDRVAFTAPVQATVDGEIGIRASHVPSPSPSAIDPDRRDGGVYVRDVPTATTLRADVTGSGGAPDGVSGAPALSSDGLTIGFHSAATNLVAGDGNRSDDVFARDLAGALPGTSGTPFTELVSVNTDGQQGNHRSRYPTVSRNGRYVGYVSAASDLVGGDTNEVDDVFVRDRLPVPTLAPDPLDLGSRTVGESSPPGTATLRNTGSGPLDVGAASLTGPAAGDFEITATTCTGGSLHRDRTCTVSVRFTPTNLGSRSATLSVPHSGPGSESVIQLVGTGLPVPVPALAASPDPADLGEAVLGRPGPPVRVTVASVGTGPVTITSVRVTGRGASEYALVATTCAGRTLPPAQTCTADLRVRPSRVTPQPATLEIASNAPDSPLRVPLRGRGLSPRLTVGPALGPPGSVPVIRGTGFPAGASVTLRWRHPEGRALLGGAEVRAGSDGRFLTPLLVFPKDQPGRRQVVASDPRWGEVTAPYLVVPGSADPPDFVSRR